VKPREPADFEWEKADALLREVESVDSFRAPHIQVHGAYYAAFHAALAVILLKDKTPPKKHDILVQQFGLLVKELPEPLRQAGRDLRELKKLRIRADYQSGELTSAEDAQRAMRMARSFFRACAQQFGFPRSGPADE
jgi:uncharacterized protein (UPF0332 family)